MSQNNEVAVIRPVQKTGICRFCNQMRLVEVNENASGEEVNNKATEECDCPEAEHERDHKRKIENVNWNIQSLIEEDGRPDVAEILYAAAETMVNANIKKVAVNINAETTVSMSRDGDGKITVEKKRIIINQADSE